MMMMVSLQRALVFAALGLCAAGPKKPAASQPHTLPFYAIDPITYVSNETCDVNGTRKNPVANVVRLHLTEGLLNHLTDGAAKNNIALDVTLPTPKCSGSYCVDDDSNKPNNAASIAPVSDPTTGVTRLDIDLTQNNNALWVPNGGGGFKPILLKIMLVGNSMSFIPYGGSGDSRSAIQTDQATNDNYGHGNMFDCRQPMESKVSSGTRTSWVQFRVKRVPQSGSVGSLNIGIIGNECNVSKPCFVIPLVLDPKVPNNG